MKYLSAFLAFILTLVFSVPGNAGSYGETYPVTHPAKATYVATIFDMPPAASPTDTLVIAGSASKTIKILSIGMNYISQLSLFAGGYTSALAITPPIYVIKRSSADTGGAATTMTAVPYNSTSPAATANVQMYTANPSLGATVGTIDAVFMSATDGFTMWANSNVSNTAGAFFKIYRAPDIGGQAITLHGTNESVAVNLSGANPGVIYLLSYQVIWTEE